MTENPSNIIITFSQTCEIASLNLTQAFDIILILLLMIKFQKIWVPMGTGYRPEKNFGYRRVPGTSEKKNFGYRWVPGTGQKKNFGYRLVPGTGKIFTYADP